MNIGSGANCNKTSGASCNRRKMKLVHFMLVIVYALFEMLKWNLNVARYWIKVDILKRFAENLLCLPFGTADV